MLKLRIIAALLIAIAVPMFAQTSRLDLRSYTRKQLVACLEKLSTCHSADTGEVSSELAKRLPALNTKTLVRCFADWHICGVDQWVIVDALSKRGDTDRIILEYSSANNWQTRSGIELLAYGSQSAVAHHYIHTVFVKRVDDGDNLYWPAMYLGKQCDVKALHYLDPGPRSKSIADKFSISSGQFAETVELFGKCHYRPAIPYLATIGLHAASLNLVDSAEHSLRVFYPDAPHFDSLDSMQIYYCERANRDGFHVKCENY